VVTLKSHRGRRGIYSIRGGDSIVTSAAIRVTVAASAGDRLRDGHGIPPGVVDRGAFLRRVLE
jgi:hypothetical protein